ncbi:hypothetical protein HPB48_012202 [Haemaphysalis longicornis]|uniref:Mitochondrial Rho GTPase n=1 Tax=Haemaphysalis longicornis TaxID=44386 RepID=A0A9J6FV14_HAELO|nr:hypothetical protein HPB48_012202 [Haemaphysalis longicornis]
MVRANGKRDVRILLVGEAGVGKTSLILSLVSEQFPEDVPPRAEEITIPADVTPEKVPTRIVDFSTQEQSQENLAEEIGKANVVCVVYAVDDDDTIDKITDYWLPLIREQLGDEHGTPVVLVGNKADLVEYSSLEMVVPIMSQYQEVETCVEATDAFSTISVLFLSVQCSAKTFKNISELFYYAQKAVLHPTGPLYVPQERDLTERCKAALTRVFRICDVDNDGVLSDRELNIFQRKCFNTPLEPKALHDLKTIVAKNLDGGVENNGLTLSGFLFLHQVFIQRGRHETTWTVLRRFGYDDHLVLPREYLCPPIRVPPGSSTELSAKGLAFVTSLFEKHDKDVDGCLSPSELASLFAVCPTQPWGTDLVGTVATNEAGWLTLRGYLAHWALTTALDVHKTLECLAYLGYIGASDENQLSAVQVTSEKQLESQQQRQSTRQVLHCRVLGPQDAGKTCFLRGLLGCSLEQSPPPGHPGSKYAVDQIVVYGQDKYLLVRGGGKGEGRVGGTSRSLRSLHEVDLFGQHDTAVAPELSCDAVCLLFDASNPRSFEHVARAYLKHLAGSSVPVLVVASKSDRPSVRQDYPVQPAEFCRRHDLPAPQTFSCLVAPPRDVYVKLATMAAYP